MIAVGVDGWRDGWIAIAIDAASREVLEGACFETFASIVKWWPDAVIGVDMPIGYATGRTRRACDVAARDYVAARRSSVFFVPPEVVLAAASYDDANVVARSLGVPAISRQLWALRSKIRDVASAVAEPDARDRVYEVFPEASFCAMAGTPLRTAKRTWHGHEERRALLAGQGVVLDPALINAASAAPDDVLDAAAVAWSAARIARGEAACLPTDAAPGLPTIWY